MARLSDQAFLSIGDVLDLLKDEFPEITISKIRFLEAQGLIDPERTPSGYRKFFQGDLARLRWVLIQQRDHFLPLKVIRDRLQAGAVPEAELAEAGAVFPGRPAAADDGSPVAGGNGAALATLSPGASAAPTPEQRLSNGHGWPDTSDLPGPSDRSSQEGAAAGEEPSGCELGSVGADAPSLGASAPHAAVAPVEIADDEVPEASPELVELAAAAEREDLTGVSLTVTELAAAAGMTVSELRELEKFGLLAGDRVGPEVFYDETALSVAQLAGRFRRHGIEPRHLRQYRVNTERELALFEQVVAPYVRQRGRMGHSHASASMAELAELGESLRRALLRRAIRDYLGEG
jgi:DNA-binding transcriptional MerR regulator